MPPWVSRLFKCNHTPNSLKFEAKYCRMEKMLGEQSNGASMGLERGCIEKSKLQRTTQFIPLAFSITRSKFEETRLTFPGTSYHQLRGAANPAVMAAIWFELATPLAMPPFRSQVLFKGKELSMLILLMFSFLDLKCISSTQIVR